MATQSLTFTLGAQITCRDGRCAKLAKIVVDPQTERVTDLIVEKGFLLKQDQVVPVAVVERATDTTIYLSIDSDELAGYEEFRETVVVDQPAPNPHTATYSPLWPPGIGVLSEPAVPGIHRRIREGISGEKVVLGPHTEVVNLHQTLGYVDQVQVEPESGRITGLVIRRGIMAQPVYLAMHHIEGLEDEEVLVTLSNEEADALPDYQSKYDEGKYDETEEVESVNVCKNLENGSRGTQLDLEAQVSADLSG